MTTTSDVRYVSGVLGQTSNVLDATMRQLYVRSRPIKWRQALAKLQALLDPTLFHATRKRVLVIDVVLWFHLIPEDAFPLAEIKELSSFKRIRD
jgi:hypothetical protein